jgi:hypothetical protein
VYWTKTPCQDDDDQERGETGSERKQALPINEAMAAPDSAAGKRAAWISRPA